MIDFATLLGFLCAMIVVGIAVALGGNFVLIIDLASFLIVIGGSVSVVLMRFSILQFTTSLKMAMKTLFYRRESFQSLINQIVTLSETARQNGLLALEKVTIHDPFLKKAIQYLIDDIDAEMIEQTLYNEMLQTVEHNTQSQQVFRALAEVGPGMGLIGTLIGLIQMFSHMHDPKNIGPAMSVALLSTLYGAILANIIANPIAGKLEILSEEERTKQLMILDAILAIQKKRNPRMIREMLNTYLPGTKVPAEINIQ